MEAELIGLASFLTGVWIGAFMEERYGWRTPTEIGRKAAGAATKGDDLATTAPTGTLKGGRVVVLTDQREADFASRLKEAEVHDQ
jgi:hypothetical protein